MVCLKVVCMTGPRPFPNDRKQPVNIDDSGSKQEEDAEQSQYRQNKHENLGRSCQHFNSFIQDVHDRQDHNGIDHNHGRLFHHRAENQIAPLTQISCRSMDEKKNV